MKNVLIIVSVFLLLVGCDKPKTTEVHLEDANSYMQEREYGEAIIELKNLLTQDSKSAEGRFLLGKLHLLTGDLKAAQKELNRALDLEYPIDGVIPLLVRSESLAGNPFPFKKYESLPLSNKALAEIYAISAMGYITQGDLLSALNTASKCIALGLENHFYTKLSTLWVAANDHQVSLSIDKSIEMQSVDSEFDDALLLTAMLHSVNADYPKALEAYDKYLDRFNKFYFVRLNYISILLANNDLEKADEYIDELLKYSENDAMLNEYKAEIAYRNEDFEQAAEHASITLATLDNSFKANFINGISQYQLGNREQAYSHLAYIENQIPKKHIAYSLLMKLKFELGYTDKAISSLDKISDFTEDDYNLLANSSWSLLKAGEESKALEYIETMENIDIKSPKSLVQRGMLKLSVAKGNGIDDLIQAIDIAPDYIQARVALLFSHLDKNNFIEALQIADDWIEEYPDTPDGYVAKGLVYKKKGDVDLAKASFERALNMDKNNIGANLHLATYAITEQDYNHAFDKITTIVNTDNLHIGALNKLIVIANKVDDSDAVLALADSLIAKNQGNVRLYIPIAQVYYALEKSEKSIEILSSIELSVKNSPGYLFLYAQISMQTQQYQKAEELFNELLLTKNRHLQANIGYILALEQQTKYQRGLSHIEMIKPLFPNNYNFTIYQARFLTLMTDYERAEGLLTNLPNSGYNQDFLNKVKAQLYAASKDYQQTVNVAEGLYKTDPSSNSLYFFVQALHRNNQHEQAISTLDEYTKENGDTARFKRLKAQIQLTSSPKEALTYYQQQVELNDRDYVSLNNLAWAAIQTNNFQLGLESALKAKTLKPENPNVNHTLALAYMGLNQYEDAEPLLTVIHEEDLGNDEFALHYAETLIQLKKIELAKTVLALVKDDEAKVKLLEQIN